MITYLYHTILENEHWHYPTRLCYLLLGLCCIAGATKGVLPEQHSSTAHAKVPTPPEERCRGRTGSAAPVACRLSDRTSEEHGRQHSDAAGYNEEGPRHEPQHPLEDFQENARICPRLAVSRRGHKIQRVTRLETMTVARRLAGLEGTSRVGCSAP